MDCGVEHADQIADDEGPEYVYGENAHAQYYHPFSEIPYRIVKTIRHITESFRFPECYGTDLQAWALRNLHSAPKGSKHSTIENWLMPEWIRIVQHYGAGWTAEMISTRVTVRKRVQKQSAHPSLEAFARSVFNEHALPFENVPVLIVEKFLQKSQAQGNRFAMLAAAVRLWKPEVQFNFHVRHRLSEHTIKGYLRHPLMQESVREYKSNH